MGAITVDALQAQQAAAPAPRPVDAAGLIAFLKRHKGPVLDVRLAEDCDPARRLKRTTHAIGYDFGPEDPEGRKMAQEEFLKRVSADRRLMSARKSGTQVLVVCCAGGRSEAAAGLLARDGFRTVHLPGGVAGEQVPAVAVVAKPK